MRNVKYDYSSCHVDVPQTLADEIIKWGQENVTDDEIFVTQRDPTFGREDEIHITILYGLHCDSANAIKSVLHNSGPVKIRFGKTNIFTNPSKFDVVVIDVYSEDLSKINLKLQESVKHTNKYPIYSPHATISYVKKGKGWRHKGVPNWNNKEFICEYAVFSSKNGIKEKIGL